jgi:para-nitrobenzyl esterase
VMCHLASPGSAGLFQRAILQSPILGSAAGAPDIAHRWTDALVRLAGGGDVPAGLKALRELQPSAVVALHEQLFKSPAFHGTSGAQPTIDPATISVSPDENAAVTPGVDVLAGTTAEEARFFFLARQTEDSDPDEAMLAAVLAHDPGVVDAPALIAAERNAASAAGRAWGPREYVAVATREMFRAPLDRWVTQRRSHGAQVYQYEVFHAGPYGALHTVDVPLVFGTYNDGGAGSRLAGDSSASEQDSRAMTHAWGAFIHGDNPGWEAADGTHLFGL